MKLKETQIKIKHSMCLNGKFHLLKKKEVMDFRVDNKLLEATSSFCIFGTIKWIVHMSQGCVHTKHDLIPFKVSGSARFDALSLLEQQHQG